MRTCIVTPQCTLCLCELKFVQKNFNNHYGNFASIHLIRNLNYGSKSILRADLLDILFENRNKEYGAYELRKTYNKRITYAVAAMFMLCLLLIVISIFAGSKKSSANEKLYVKDFELIKAPDEKDKEEIKQPPVKHEVQQVATRRVTIPIIVRNDDVKPEDRPPANDEL
ncbi:MAG TPA: hypothetical protein VN958_21240, partial [Chitinophagaceae bacterium]|nr:hypothetical protein [Chitinophagaceae bacterium]